MEHISGQYIKHLREERGMTLRSFAEMIYASKSSVYRWEQAHVPENEDILQRIAAVFGTDVAALREGSAQFTAQQKAEQTAGGAEDTATFALWTKAEISIPQSVFSTNTKFPITRSPKSPFRVPSFSDFYLPRRRLL